MFILSPMLNLLSAKNVGITKKPSFPSNNIGDDRTLSSSIMTFIDLFKNLYHYVDSTTDQKEFKFNNDDLIQKIQNELSKQYSAEDIEKALSKCQEVFALVVKERMANLTN